MGAQIHTKSSGNYYGAAICSHRRDVVRSITCLLILHIGNATKKKLKFSRVLMVDSCCIFHAENDAVDRFSLSPHIVEFWFLCNQMDTRILNHFDWRINDQNSGEFFFFCCVVLLVLRLLSIRKIFLETRTHESLEKTSMEMLFALTCRAWLGESPVFRS